MVSPPGSWGSVGWSGGGEGDGGAGRQGRAAVPVGGAAGGVARPGDHGGPVTPSHARGEHVPVIARAAASRGLARAPPAGVAVLLLERHGSSRMAPGAFAFPGGRVEPSDAPPDADRLCRGLTADAAAPILHDVTPPERAIGFWIAALREAFEETGLLLAYDREGAPFAPDAPAAARLAE